VNPKSLRFRLIGWYAGLLLAVMIAFAAYTYEKLDHYLFGVLSQTLSRRALQIGDTLLAKIVESGEPYVRNEIETLYAPSLNDRFIRVTRRDGSVLYVSGLPNDKSFIPTAIPPPPGVFYPETREEKGENGARRLLIATSPFSVGHEGYLVEVGASEAGMESVLRGFVTTLAIGLPIVLAIAISGGYILIKRALAPVQRIVRAAREITLHHLDERLPVVSSGDEIESLCHSLNEMIGRLDESFQSSSRFTADASHELRTPLTIMRGELEALLLDTALPPKVNQTLDSFLEETERLVKIVEGLFALSRLDIGEAQMECVRVDLAALAQTTADQMCLLAEEKEIVLSYETRDHVDVEGDRARLKQVVVNLLDNAIKYTPRGGEITLSVSSSGGRGRLVISDSGPGIPETALSRVFDRFFRVDGARSREVEGAGLGLSIVRSICAAHGGSVRAENRETTGCRITVEFPLASRTYQMAFA